MKKKSILFSLFFGGLMLLQSCATEETAVTETSSFKLEKTTEMLAFESSVKEWMTSRITAKKNLEANTIKTEDNKDNSLIRSQAVELLRSIGVKEAVIADYSKTDTEQLVASTMKAYSSALRKLYNEQKTLK